MVVAIGVEVRDTVDVLDGGKDALLLLGADLAACGGGGLD
jgi:hypothetical protein